MKRKISVFIASPGDLSTERSRFRDAVQNLNIGFGDGANVEFEPLGWEDTLASTGRRNQSVINTEIDRCQVFILVMHRRWGQEAPDAKPYSSYTEEEFHRALERWKREGIPEIFVFFKRVDPTSEADPGPQLKKVMDFRKQLEETRQVLYHYFEDGPSFIYEVDRHLRAYAKGELPKADRQENILVLPSEVLEEVERAKTVAENKIKEAEDARDAEKEAYLKIDAIQLEIAQDAASLSREGKVEFARQKFASLVVDSSNIEVLYLGYEFYRRTGDFNSALSVLEKWLTLSGPNEKSPETASAYCNLGILYQARGELERAEEMYQQCLAISEVSGRKTGMASAYGNLGILYKERDELERAEDMYQKALALEHILGRKEGLANSYGNLGTLYKARGELERAEDMYNKSLAIEQELDRKEGMASDYGNLGNLYWTRGEIGRAKEMYQKCLAIEEVLDHKEGMANAYSNLGTLYEREGDFESAERMLQKSLEIREALGRREHIAKASWKLGNLYYAKGELGRAKDILERCLLLVGESKSPMVDTISGELASIIGKISLTSG